MRNDEDDLERTYGENLASWRSLLNGICESISGRLQIEELGFTSKVRVKSLESLVAKRTRLGRAGAGRGSTVRDLLGLRFVVPFLEDVERVVGAVEAELPVLDIERKSERLSYREFAYDSVHMEVSLENLRIELPDFCSPVCEIQIRTILQEAWAEMEHILVYKSDTEFAGSKAFHRKIAALNANLVLSDMIFQEMRDKQKELEVWGRGRFRELEKRARGISAGSLPKYLVAIRDDDRQEPHAPAAGGDFESILLKALEAHNSERYRQAVDLYSEALAAAPPLKVRAIMYNHRGLAHFMLNRERHALKDFEDGFRCDPGYYQVLNNRALVLRRMGLIDEALYNFDRSLEIEGNQPEVHYFKAQTRHATQDYRPARHDAEMAIRLRPGYLEAESLLQEILRKLSEAESAQGR